MASQLLVETRASSKHGSGHWKKPTTIPSHATYNPEEK
jgi:hypothetical protein